jgi:hypothetical protein
MNCEDFERNVTDLAREQMMVARARAEFVIHREECESCARRLEEECALSFKLRALAADTNAVTVPSVGHELRAALRNRQVAMMQTASPARRRFRAVISGAMAVAAAVLLVMTLAIIRSRTMPMAPAAPLARNPAKTLLPATPAPDETTAIKRPDGVVAPVPGPMPAPLPIKDPELESPRVVKSIVKNVVKNNARRNATRIAAPSSVTAVAFNNDLNDLAGAETAMTDTADSSAAEITTDFMPVGYASAANLQEGGQLVRVELPRSALVAFGLPMNFNRYDEKVKADVFFGADGMARAIRFVQ